MKKYTIWQNFNTDYDCMREDYQEVNMLSDKEMEEISDDDVSMWAYEINAFYLDDERANLDIKLDEEIVVIADLGLWDGRHRGYKTIDSGNIKDCLSDEDCIYAEWYCDRYDMRFTGSHHDGTNHYLYRVFKSGLSETRKENFLEKLYTGKATRKDITRYTDSIRPYISKVYGWN